jgi:hypothetical protein
VKGKERRGKVSAVSTLDVRRGKVATKAIDARCTLLGEGKETEQVLSVRSATVSAV